MIKNYIELFLRHKWLFITLFIIGIGISIGYSLSLPSLYQSSTLILVEPQRIPVSYVNSTVTSTVQERLSTISQQILSRTNLERIILQYNLYKWSTTDHDNHLYNTIIGNINKSIKEWSTIDLWKIATSSLFQDDTGSPPMETLVERMRKDIEIKVIGGNNAFTISYIGQIPIIVMKVTNTLASLFIEENLKIREQQAEGTSEFLAGEHAEAKRELEKQEKSLKDFKEQRMGALPEQMDANLRTLDRLQMEIQTINDALKNTEDRRIFYEGQLAEIERQSALLKSEALNESGAGPTTGGLDHLRGELTKLLAEFNENYPDVLVLRNQIRELEEQNTRPNTSAALSRVTGGNSSRLTISSQSPQVQTLKNQLQPLYSELSSLRSRQRRTLELINEYERRVEKTFGNEQKLLDLSRDYETSQKAYQELLQKRLAARISENLEKRQKAEQFRIVDPAKVPEKPYKPDRRKIILLGSLLSAGIGVGIILLQDYLRPSYRKPDDFHSITNLPVLTTISSHKIMRGKSSLLVILENPDSLIAEQYRLLYTRVTQLSKEKPQTVFAVSSAMEDEGKTITAMNLAMVAARDFGKKTLLIEGDFKHPTFAKYLDLNFENSLVDVLSQKIDLQSCLVRVSQESLTVLPFGKSVKNSSRLLNSAAMKDLLVLLREQYDFIVIDSPPILSLLDMHLLERLVDGILLVVRAERTPREAVTMAINSLPTEKFLGIILNDAQQSTSRYSRYSYMHE
jgi:succinoglycan biosynthesis transport protein ExoP